MSDSIDIAFVQQYNENIIHLLQQKGSKLMRVARRKDITGKATHFDRMGISSVSEITTSPHVISFNNPAHSRRKLTLRDFVASAFVSEEDDLRLIISPGSEIAMSQSMALGRRLDQLIIDAAVGTAISVAADDSTSTVSFDTSMVVDEDEGTANSNLTVAKLRAARKLLDKSNGGSMEKAYVITNVSGRASLLADTTLTSSDYNTVKALVQGELSTFMGFEFITVANGMLPGTPDGTDSNLVICIALTESALGLAMAKDISTRIDVRPDLAHGYQIVTKLHANATRIEEGAVVKIECVQASGDN